MRKLAFLFLPLLLTFGCERTTPTAPDEALPASAVSEGVGPYFSSENGFDKAGFVPFVSFGHGCDMVFLGPPEFVNGTMILNWSNFNLEVSKEDMFAGPATSTARAVIDVATGKFLEFDIAFVHEPTAVNGTWETAQYDILLIDGEKPIKSYLSGVGTGDLEGLGIEYMGVINAKASATPPHIECSGGGGPFLTKGKIFELD
jgi:hypothetical protein